VVLCWYKIAIVVLIRADNILEWYIFENAFNTLNFVWFDDGLWALKYAYNIENWDISREVLW